MDFSKIKTAFLDGDGVLWRSSQPMPGLNEFFDALANKGIQWALLTNNNTHSVQDYVNKLTGFGIPTEKEQIFSSVTATLDYLMDHYPAGSAMHIVGMDALIDAVKEAGFQVTASEEVPQHAVKAVVAGMDRELTLKKVEVAMRQIFSGADYIATNVDGSYPTPAGLSPGTGMVIGALHYAAETAPLVIGKPERFIFETALKRMHAEKESTIMIGDRISTDILGAHGTGLTTIAVLTGVSTREDIDAAEVKPDYVYDNIGEITAAINGQ